MATLLAIPVILGAITWLVVDVSPWLAVSMGFAFVVGVQAAIAKRWTGLRPKPVSPQEAPEIHAAVERLCSLGNLAKPRIVLHDKRYPNSWLNGLRSRHSTLHLTSRLLELLDEHQLEAVIAHELSHLGQRDSVLMSAVGTPVAAMLDGAGLYFHTPIAVMRSAPAKAGQSSPPTGREQASALITVPPQVWIIYLLLLPIGLLFLVVGAVCRAITALFSRARELEADAGAARLTGNPAALASALIALSGESPDTIPQVDLRRAASLDVFHIIAIGKEYPLVHTHPPLRRRLKQLEVIEKRLQASMGCEP